MAHNRSSLQTPSGTTREMSAQGRNPRPPASDSLRGLPRTAADSSPRTGSPGGKQLAARKSAAGRALPHMCKLVLG